MQSVVLKKTVESIFSEFRESSNVRLYSCYENQEALIGKVCAGMEVEESEM